MTYDQSTLYELIACFGILCLVMIHPWMRRVKSVGLPLCYILNLAMIHWLGGLIHVVSLPWRSKPDTFTEVGFHQAFWGTAAFAVGNFLIAPLLSRLFVHDAEHVAPVKPRPEQLRLPQTYLLIGLASFGLLAPALKSIPSVGAVSVCGIYLAVVGVCLACWSATMRQDYL